MTVRLRQSPGDLMSVYLTDGARLMQIISVGETEVMAEDVSCRADKPAAILNVPISDIGQKWRKVTPAT